MNTERVAICAAQIATPSCAEMSIRRKIRSCDCDISNKRKKEGGRGKRVSLFFVNHTMNTVYSAAMVSIPAALLSKHGKSKSSQN